MLLQMLGLCLGLGIGLGLRPGLCLGLRIGLGPGPLQICDLFPIFLLFFG